MKTKMIFPFIFGAAAAFAVHADTLPQVGVIPVPVMHGMTLGVQTSHSDADGVYYYRYTVTNPAANTGKIWEVYFDMTAPSGRFPHGANIPLTMPYGAAGVVDFNEVSDAVFHDNIPHAGTVLEFGERLPAGWSGSVSSDGFGSFWVSNPANEIMPGQVAGPFVVFSPGQPTIKNLKFVPDWILKTTADEATLQEQELAATVEANMSVYVPALGPSPFDPLTDPQWNQLRDDINKAIQLGWISDATLGQALANQLAAARSTFDAQGPGFIQGQLEAMQATLNASTAAQRNQEAYDLVQLNIQAMLANVPPPGGDPEPQTSPKLSLTLDSPAALAIGDTVTFTAHVVDQANNDAPISGYEVTIQDDGENANDWSGVTDDQGNFTVSYTGHTNGSDIISLQLNSEVTADQFAITWSGGMDLTISTFVPPFIKYSGTGTIHITEATKNIGTTAAPPTFTSYYISSSVPFDWATAQYVTGREIPALAPGQSADNGGMDVALPDGMAPGTYTMQACADAYLVAEETDESNNCQANMLAAAMERDSGGPQGPDCSTAVPTDRTLWPPNHKFASVGINGVTDPANLPITLTVTGIQQDEPVDDKGSGHTAQDGTGVGTSTAQVRVERSGTAMGGRLYFINFRAQDSAGGSCTGTVSVGVPHDQGQHDMPVDNGQRFDSTATH